MGGGGFCPIMRVPAVPAVPESKSLFLQFTIDFVKINDTI